MSSNTTVTRDDSPVGQLSLLKHIRVEWGEKADWDTLCELHYKGHSLAAGSRYVRCVLQEPGEPAHLIGIMVFANPQPLSKGRNEVFPRLKPNVDGRDNRMINQTRMSWINKNMTWNNRTVLDTMYRSAGIAYRFKNLAYRMYCARYGRLFVESVSSMGRFNPFSIKTGMKFTKPKPAGALEPGLQFFASNFVSDPSDIEAVRAELRAKSPADQVLYERKLREFYYRWSSMEKSGDKRDLGMTRIDGLSIDYVLKEIMQLVFSATVYWVWTAVDARGSLPETMPLYAFDEQGPNEPLARSWL
jgi:ABC-type ATPase with predicted acetyltransferase domain